jgi:hypothetical protein
MSSKKIVVLPILNVLVYITTVVVNSFAGATTLLNGRTTGQVSDAYPTLVTPSGFTFSIWGIIYILLGAFAVYQVLPRNRDKSFLKRIDLLFVSSGVLNISWIFLWQYGLFSYSVIFIFGLLVSLIAIYLRLDIGKAAVSFTEKVLVHLPFSVYLGWITIASIANVAVALTATGWNGGGIDPSIWAVTVAAVALIITLIVIATRKDVGYGLVIAWALLGIMTKQSGNQRVFWATGVGIIIVLAALVVTAFALRMKKS